MTSFDVIRKMRKILGVKKMWHIGTLDPMADGLMLIATEQSTKLLSFINSNKKTYFFTVRLDGKSESLDLEKPIEPIDVSKRKIPDKNFLFQKISETTEQIPPKFSAIHIDGKRAYDLARKWRDFDIPKRKISVSDVEIISVSEEEISLRLTISSGGYIRSFAPMIGELCGIDGGYISVLRREKLFFWKHFVTLGDAENLENLTREKYISEETIFPDFPFFVLDDEKVLWMLKNGIVPNISELIEKIPDFSEAMKNSQKFFLFFPHQYASLLEWNGENCKILKNDAISFL